MTSDAANKHIEIIRDKLGDKSLVIVGLMGAGKSAIGRTIAGKLDWPFIDADTEIETAAKRTIAEIFESFGEEEFRRAEEKVIERILGSGPQVLATGGGAYMNENTRNNIATNGLSVWLSADLDLLMARVSKKSTRPLLKKPNPRQIMADLMAERYPVYAKADIEVASSDISKDEMANRVLAAVANHLTNPQDQQ